MRSARLTEREALIERGIAESYACGSRISYACFGISGAFIRFRNLCVVIVRTSSVANLMQHASTLLKLKPSLANNKIASNNGI